MVVLFVLVATVSGRVLRVNKLLGVVPFRARYKGDVGDVVIGRVAEVQQKRWKLEVRHLIVYLRNLVLSSFFPLPLSIEAFSHFLW
jgi:exosome complex RNA-binding protein Rrp4